MSSFISSDVVKTIPKTLKFDNRYDHGVLSRTTRSYPASNNEYSTSGISMISVQIPALGWVDMISSYLVGRLEFANGLTLSRSIHDIFRRVVITASNGSIIIDCDNYNLLSSILQDCTLSSEEQNRSFAITTLMGSDQYRTDISSGVSFAFHPLISILRSEKAIPLQYLGALTINFYLADVREAFTGTSASLGNNAATYKVRGVRYNVDVLTVDEATESLARAAWRDGRMKWHLTSWSSFPCQSRSANYDLRIETLNNSIKALIIAPRRVGVLTTQAVNSFDRYMGDLLEYRIQIGTNVLERVDTTYGNATGYMELEKLLQFTNSGSITPENWTKNSENEGTKFVIGCNLETVHDDNVYSGYAGKGSIVVNLRYLEEIPELVQYNSFVQFDVVLTSSESSGTRVLF